MLYGFWADEGHTRFALRLVHLLLPLRLGERTDSRDLPGDLGAEGGAIRFRRLLSAGAWEGSREQKDELAPAHAAILSVILEGRQHCVEGHPACRWW